ncbi:MAG: RNA-binding protein [Chloroflexi bacterium]|nr:RNA-binding protein [Chloroflexota bacterium]
MRIYAGNLAKSTTQDEIKALFTQEGEVTSVDSIKDRDSGQAKGFAFVTMTSRESADKAISKYNAHTLAGNQCKVNVAKPRVERARTSRHRDTRQPRPAARLSRLPPFIPGGRDHAYTPCLPGARPHPNSLGPARLSESGTSSRTQISADRPGALPDRPARRVSCSSQRWAISSAKCRPASSHPPGPDL